MPCRRMRPGTRPRSALLAALMPLAAELDPDTYGGAMLLGVDGVCIISHGSSSARAIVNAVGVADHAVKAGLVDQLRAAISRRPGRVPSRSSADDRRLRPAAAPAVRDRSERGLGATGALRREPHRRR